MSADLIARLIEAGTPAGLVAETALLLGRAERLLEAEVDREIATQRRAQHVRDLAAERQRKHRAGNGSRSSRVTRVTERDMRDAAPAPNKNPPDPHKLTPTPREGDAHAHEADPVPVRFRLAAAQIAIAALIGDVGRRRWRKMPPPAGVGFDQWAGFLAHRKAHRKSLTDRAYDLLCGKLERFSDDEWPPGRIIDTIIDRGWMSFERAWLDRITEQERGRANGHATRGGDGGWRQGGHDRPSAWASRLGGNGFEPASLDD